MHNTTCARLEGPHFLIAEIWPNRQVMKNSQKIESPSSPEGCSIVCELLPWDRQRKGCLGSIHKKSQSRSADMHNTTCARLEGPHFLIAEIWPNRQVMKNSQKIEAPSSPEGCSIVCELLPWDRQRKGCLGSIHKKSQSRSADMHNTTCARLEGPHFLIAEIWPNRQVMKNSQKIESPSSPEGCSIVCELLPWDRQRKGCLGSIHKKSQSRSADMHNTTCARLEGPHFLIAEIWPNRQVMKNSQKIEAPSSRDGCSIFCELLPWDRQRKGCLGSIRKRSQSRSADMHNTTCARLEGPHFLIAEIWPNRQVM